MAGKVFSFCFRNILDIFENKPVAVDVLKPYYRNTIRNILTCLEI